MIFVRVVVAMLVAFAMKGSVSASLPEDLLHGEIHGVGAYLEVLGALYGIVLAFIIFVVWDQFNKVQTGIYHEASALEDLCHTASTLSDREVSLKLRRLVRDYIAISVDEESAFLSRGEMCPAATKAFLHVADAVREIEVGLPRDQVVLGELFTALARVNTARDSRLGVSGARIPSTLWHLVIFCSLALFGGFLCLGIRAHPLAELLVSIIAGCVVFLLSVIEDMDDPFEGAWVISYAPFAQVGGRLQNLP